VSASEDLARLAHDYWEGVLRRNPVVATFYGDERYNDRLPDVGPDGRAQEERAQRDALARLQTIDHAQLSDEERISWDMLRLMAQMGLDALRLRLDEMGVDQMEGPQVWLPDLLNWQPTDTPEQVEQLIVRFQAFDSTYMDQYLDALRDGVRDGRTAPRIAVERVIGQLQAMLAKPPEASPFAAPLPKLGAGQAERLRLTIAESLYPAYERFLRFLTDGGYLDQHARTEPGVWSVTSGDEIYTVLARQHTTTELTPRQMHDIGREDLARIHDEMRQIMRQQGEDSGSIRAFTERLVHDPPNLPSQREEIVESARRLLESAQAVLPRAFGHLPKTPCEVRPIEEYREKDMVAAYYNQPSADGSRPGIFYVNTYDPPSRPRHTLPALVFHESVPGHHLQIALAQETQGLPTFRRLSAGWMANAFVEGWALYTERLSDELGLYPDDLARYGMLGYQAWRACRLVVDTGMHALRWSRQQAIDFLFDNVGLTERETVNEVDRYIVWPGQALSYKIGQREIESLRREHEQRRGPSFDVREFHDELLRHAAVPLSTLRLMLGPE
jgi:prolyl oligopeptidase